MYILIISRGSFSFVRRALAYSLQFCSVCPCMFFLGSSHPKMQSSPWWHYISNLLPQFHPLWGIRSIIMKTTPQKINMFIMDVLLQIHFSFLYFHGRIVVASFLTRLLFLIFPVRGEIFQPTRASPRETAWATQTLHPQEWTDSQWPRSASLVDFFSKKNAGRKPQRLDAIAFFG